MRTEISPILIPAAAEFHGILWLPENTPRAVLQVTHGMTEHIGRYQTFAQTLTDQGIAVAGFDLPGHGRNSGSSDCASLGKSGWALSLDAIRILTHQLKTRFPDVPHIMLGFSLGSFLLRDYLNQTEALTDGVVFLGTGNQPHVVLALLKHIVGSEIDRFGFDTGTPLVRKLSFDAYNKKFAPNRTCADWLCSDAEQLDAYLADPLCHPEISSGLFWQLLDGMQRTGSSHGCNHLPEDLPVLLLSGAKDPVGGFGRGVNAVEKQFTRAGLSHVKKVLIPEARHDLLHECESGSSSLATKEILTFCNDVIQKK